MNILFFFVHPSKYYLFRNSINKLKNEGHKVEITILTKDILEDLIKAEGWDYTNILPTGRRSKSLPPIVATIYFSLKTVLALLKYTKGKKFDLFITDDLLAVVGKLKKVPTYVFSDDDLKAVKEVYPLYALATKIISPACTDMGKFNTKKLGYKGYHELAYLSPKYFKPDFEKTKQFNPDGGEYFILRLVSLTATHDKGKKGITNEKVRELIKLLEKHGKVYITSERELPEEFKKYRIKINPLDIAHALYFAEMFIGDSQTMTSEAAVLGTPALRCNDFVGIISSMEEKEIKYNLTYGFKPVDFDKLLKKAEELLKMKNLKQVWLKRRDRMLKDCVDVNEVIYQEILKIQK